MYPFYQKVAGYNSFLSSEINNSSIIPYALEGGGIHYREVFGQMVYQAKLSQLREVGSMGVFVF